MGTEGMTARQAKAIEQIKNRIVATKSHGHPEENEFKTFNVEVLTPNRLVSLVTEYGNKNDAGTYASLMCRDRRHFMIRARGGIELVTFDANLQSSYPKGVKGLFKTVNYWHPKKKGK